RAGAKGLTEVRLAASDLSGSAGRIAAKNIALYREHYIDIFQPSRASKAPTGWYPDALIPLGSDDDSGDDDSGDDDDTGDDDDSDEDDGALVRYPAQPMNVEPGTNQ